MSGSGIYSLHSILPAGYRYTETKQRLNSQNEVRIRYQHTWTIKTLLLRITSSSCIVFSHTLMFMRTVQTESHQFVWLTKDGSTPLPISTLTANSYALVYFYSMLHTWIKPCPWQVEWGVFPGAHSLTMTGEEKKKGEKKREENGEKKGKRREKRRDFVWPNPPWLKCFNVEARTRKPPCH